MPKSYSGDLRKRAIEAVEGGASRHEAAERVRRDYYDPDRNRRTLFGALDALVPPAGPPEAP